MSQVAALLAVTPSSTPSMPSLGPARVVDTRPARLAVELRDGTRVEARLALAFPYLPALEDEVLVIGNDEGHYVIGVLHGTGRSFVALPGDTEIRALDGQLKLVGERGISIEGPRFSLVTQKMQVVAEAVVEKLGTLHKTVTELFSLRAGEVQTLVDGTIHQQSKRATILTEERVYINGKKIDLG